MTKAAHFLWFLPMDIDVAQIGEWPPKGAAPTIDHLVKITQTAERAGFEGLLVATSYHNLLDNMTTASAVLAQTHKPYLLLAIRPNQYHPAQAAKMLASLCQLFPNRVRINVTTGGWPEDRWIGNADEEIDRERRLMEWLYTVTAIWYGTGADEYRPLHYRGDYYWTEGARLRAPLEERIKIALSGSSTAALWALAEFGSEYLIFAAPVEEVAAQVEGLHATPGCADIPVTMRVHLVVRETQTHARAAAAELIARVDPRVRRTSFAQQRTGRSARARQNALAAAEDLYVAPNLWAGVGTGRYGAATALVGDPHQIADRLSEYRSAGVSGFIVSGYPKLVECERFETLLAPILVERGLLDPQL
jgi:alkanesulfonate monooxygenase